MITIYDNETLEFVQSETAGLSTMVNGDVVKCIYVDITNVDTKEFKIKFKAEKITSETTISVTNVKNKTSK